MILECWHVSQQGKHYELIDCQNTVRKTLDENCRGIGATCGSPEASGAIEAEAGQERAHSGRRRAGGGSCGASVRVGESERELTLLIQRILKTNASTQLGAGTLAYSLADSHIL